MPIASLAKQSAVEGLNQG